MASRLPVIAAMLLVVSGCALTDADRITAAAGASTVGASTVGATASGGPASAGAREAVHGEALAAARQQRATFARDLDFLKN